MANEPQTISLADVTRWREESSSLGAQVQRLLVRKENLDQRVAKAEELFRLLGMEPAEAPAAPPAEPPVDDAQTQAEPSDQQALAVPPPIRSDDGRDYGRVTFVEAVRGAVLHAPEGRISPQMVREALADTEIGEKLRESDKGFYHAISRLSERREIIKHNGWLFTPEAYAAHMERVRTGMTEDFPAPDSPRSSPMAAVIFKYLEDMGPADGGRIVRHLLNHSEFKDTLSKGTSGAYNVLSRLVKRKQLVKDGNEYALPSSEDPHKGGLL